MDAILGRTIITYHNGPDSYGRVAFTLEWWQRCGVFFDDRGKVIPDVTEGIKAQCFHTDPAFYIAQFRAMGDEVIEIDERGR